MGYRLTQTDKWDDKWFRSMGPLRKLVFLFLCDKCDLAGFYEIDLEDMVFRIKADEEHILGAIQGLDRGLLAPDGIEDGKVVWVKKFLLHQKNLPINPQNNAHKHIIECLKRRGDFGIEVIKKLGADKGLLSPIGKGKGKGKGKEGGTGGKQLMKNSGVTLEDIQVMFAKTNDMQHADAEYYFNVVLDWSTANGKMGSDWRSAVRNWARKDLREHDREFKSSKKKIHQRTIKNPYE